jgi:hypothetical protein
LTLNPSYAFPPGTYFHLPSSPASAYFPFRSPKGI